MTTSPASPNPKQTRLAKAAVGLVVTGFFIFLIGMFPSLIGLDFTEGIGVLQIFVLMVGLGLMTLGGYEYAYATRHRALPRSLREDVGVRLMATGYVLCLASGFADVLGIGSHFGAERPLFGLFQATGVMMGVVIIVVGLLLYAPRSKSS